ncbi:hypothetical protein CAC42_1220 [Sphaceloma murrayae]|uniref:Methyltransferase type 11 domain-containing protein n=1 Tax=Sphaceloma murrayae TaxID=2082308 RepID=A0A2K1R2D1_9PEZI|nr:hypothetical protein CAC42_1220 [Sphaceloma murrayae]
MDQVLRSKTSLQPMDMIAAISAAPARPTTAPPQRDRPSMLASGSSAATEVPPGPRLRRKKSTIGQLAATQVQTSCIEPPVKLEQLQPGNSPEVVTERRPHGWRTSVSEDQSEIQPKPSPTKLHPALRERSFQENRLSVTPLSYAPSSTPSTRYTASPAMSQVSSRTSVSSYSPNMSSASFAARKDERRGPSLPSSPKAFKPTARSADRPAPVDSRHPLVVPPEFAHLNVEVDTARNLRTRPRRPNRDGTPDLSDMSAPVPVVHSELSPRPMSGERFASPVSPSSEGRRRFFGFGSRSSSRESQHRKDSGVYASPISDDGKLAKGWSTGSPRSDSTAPSPGPEEISRPGSASRFGRLLGRSRDETRTPRTLRKGPAAGTGHEGYGKFGFRGRTFSFSSLKSAGRSSSVDSTGSRASSRNGDDQSESETEASLGYSSAVVARPDTPLVDEQALIQSGLIVKKHKKGSDGDSFARRISRGQSPQVEILNHFDSTTYIGVQAQPQRHAPETVGSTERPRSATSRQPRRWNFFQRAQAKENTVVRSDGSQPNRDANHEKLGFYAADHDESSVDLRSAQEFANPDIRAEAGSPRRQSAQPEPPGLVPYDARHASLMPPPHPQGRKLSGGQSPSGLRPKSFRLDSSESPELLQATMAQSAKPTTMIDAPKAYKRDGVPIVSGNAFALGIRGLQPLPQGPSVAESETSEEQFISFPPRKNSEISYTSSSGAASFHSASTLVAPVHTNTWLGDEDVWNEYNDFIDEVLPTKAGQGSQMPKTPPSTASSLSAPFQYDDTRGSSRPESKFLPQIHALIEDLEAPPPPSEEPACDSPDRFSQYLQPAATPSTPYSLSDIMAGYGERTASYASTKGRQSGVSDVRQSMESGYSSHYSRMSGPSRPMSRPEIGETISPVIEESEPSSAIDETASRKSRRSADADLRFGALMTSKWLSFGRVLFSPAHYEALNGEDVRVLVVDGLGKDWSYYCALTYPKATFYNLEVTGSDGKSSNRGQDLSNYRNVRHSSIGSPFPFPRGFFTAVIFRFPIAVTDKAYHACIFECKRVLRPGGFLELSVLDLDMMNMGTNARRALRNLKMDMHAKNEQISLRNLGDMMLTLIGRRGFDNIQRCIVGIPVAGRIPRSQDMSSDSDSRSSLQRAISRHERGGRPKTKDFAGILYSQQSSSPSKARDNDEGITKMVAKVGRWWYSTCYGSIAGSETSLWEQQGLLRECEKQGTAFRLLLCYAQKPTCPPRRTASV